MIKTHLLFVVLSLIGGNLSAQTMNRWRIPDLSGDNMIVREWTPYFTMGYGTTRDGEGCFFIQGVFPSQVMTATLPIGYTVTDFRILHDTVFFCGTDTTTSHGIVGLFDIYALFTGTGNINFGYLCYNMPSTSTSYNVHPKRMDLFSCRGVTHIAFVGDLLYSDAGSSYVVSTVGDACWGGSNWIVDHYNESARDMTYTDVSASSSHIVVPAKKNNSNEFYVEVFEPSTDMLMTRMNPGYMFKITGDSPMDGIVVVDTSADDFALAYHYVSGGLTGSAVQLLHVNTSLLTVDVTRTMHTPHGTSSLYSSNWMVKQLCMDNVSHRLLLLHDSRSSVVTAVESTISKYDMSTPTPIPTPALLNLSYVPGVRLDRMDASTSGGYWTIGLDSPMLTLSKEIYPAIILCRKEYQLGINTGTDVAANSPYTPTRVGPVTIGNNTMAATTGRLALELHCEE